MPWLPGLPRSWLRRRGGERGFEVHDRGKIVECAAERGSFLRGNARLIPDPIIRATGESPPPIVILQHRVHEVRFVVQPQDRGVEPSIQVIQRCGTPEKQVSDRPMLRT
jgi:hypothetical protein